MGSQGKMDKMETIPRDLWPQVLEHLDNVTLARLLQVAKFLFALVDKMDRYWKHKFLRKYPGPESDDTAADAGGWKDLYHSYSSRQQVRIKLPTDEIIFLNFHFEWHTMRDLVDRIDYLLDQKFRGSAYIERMNKYQSKSLSKLVFQGNVYTRYDSSRDVLIDIIGYGKQREIPIFEVLWS